MELKELKLKSVLYYMQSFVVTAGGKSFEVPRAMISGIQIDKKFTTMIYPIYYVSLSLPIWMYREVIKNTENISVSMVLQYRLGSENDKMTAVAGGFTTEISGNFKAETSYTTPITDTTIQTKTEKDDQSYQKSYAFNQYAMCEFALYNKAAYAASFNSINAVLTSTNMTDAFAYCITKCGINNVIMSSADNNRQYSEFKILPVSGVKNMLRIVEDYNFHSPGSVLFFDLVDSYLITKKIGCHAWKTNEYKTTHIVSLSELSDSLASFSGVFVNSKDKDYYIGIPKGCFQLDRMDGSPLLKSNRISKMLKFTTDNAIMSALTPNKLFVVNIDSPDARDYNGKYAIFNYAVSLVPSGEFFKATFEIVLYN